MGSIGGASSAGTTTMHRGASSQRIHTPIYICIRARKCRKRTQSVPHAVSDSYVIPGVRKTGGSLKVDELGSCWDPLLLHFLDPSHRSLIFIAFRLRLHVHIHLSRSLFFLLALSFSRALVCFLSFDIVGPDSDPANRTKPLSTLINNFLEIPPERNSAAGSLQIKDSYFFEYEKRKKKKKKKFAYPTMTFPRMRHAMNYANRLIVMGFLIISMYPNYSPRLINNRLNKSEGNGSWVKIQNWTELKKTTE